MLNILLIMLIYLAVFYISMFISTILHELGHAVMALILTKNDVIIKLGNDKLIKNIKIKRLTTELHQSPFIGFTYFDTEGSWLKRALICLSGPIVSFVVALIIFRLIADAERNIYIFMLQIYGYVSLFQGIMTIIPMIYRGGPYGGHKSDGYLAVEVIADHIKSKRNDRENKPV